MTGTTYSISAPTRLCAATGQEIATGQMYVAALVQSLENEEFARLDYTPEAWDSGARPARPFVLLGHWRATLPAPGAKPRMLVDDTSLLDLFEQAQEHMEREPSPQREAFRFVLALILIRKRLLVVEKSRGGSLFVRPKGGGGPRHAGPIDESSLVEVTDPRLDESSIASVAEQLQAVLSDALATPTAPSAAGGGGGSGAAG